MDGFLATDRELILSCVTDDVVWEIRGMFRSEGRAAFSGHIVDPGFAGNPVITVVRMTEEDDVVVAEGTVLARREDGTVLPLAFCDVFEMTDAKIQRLVSYLVPTEQNRQPLARDVDRSGNAPIAPDRIISQRTTAGCITWICN